MIYWLPGICIWLSQLRFNNESEIYLKKYVRLRFWLYDKTLTTLREPFDSDWWNLCIFLFMDVLLSDILQ